MSTPKQQLDEFIDKYTPEIARRGRAAISKVRTLTPGATELVYDNYNALVIGFGPSERASEAILSIAFYPKWITVFFLQAAKSRLPDPQKRLKGSGSVARHVVLEHDEDLDDPVILALIEEATARAGVPFSPSARRKLVIRSISAKQRPRRPRQTSSV